MREVFLCANDPITSTARLCVCKAGAIKQHALHASPLPGKIWRCAIKLAINADGHLILVCLSYKHISFFYSLRFKYQFI